MKNEFAANTCNHPARGLTPWLTAGALSAEDARMVEAHLRVCPVCRTEQAWDRDLIAALKSDDRIEFAPQAALTQFMSQLDADAAHEAQPPGRPASHGWRSMASAALVSGLAVALTSWAIVSSRSPSAPAASYTTLTTPEPAPRTASLRVVVKPETSLAEFAALLQAIDAQVISGPTSAGVFTIALSHAPSSGVAHALEQLRADPRVQFAEPLTP